MVIHRQLISYQPRQHIGIAFCAIAVLLVLFLATSSTPPAVKAKIKNSASSVFTVPKSQTSDTGCCGDKEGDQKPHLLAGSYYTVKDGLSAKLLLNNKGPSPLEVKPTIFTTGGQKFEVPAIVVGGNSFVFVNIADWLAWQD